MNSRAFKTEQRDPDHTWYNVNFFTNLSTTFEKQLCRCKRHYKTPKLTFKSLNSTSVYFLSTSNDYYFTLTISQNLDSSTKSPPKYTQKLILKRNILYLNK